MAIEKFALEALTRIDGGRINEAFNQALRRCESDCRDRPGTGKARRITLVVDMLPICDDRAELESVNVAFRIAETIPKRESKTYNMRATTNGLLFNELAPDDVRQTTLDDVPDLKKVN